MQLSPHFTLAELAWTSHRTIDNHAPPEVVARLTALCRELLEPLREAFGPLRVTSGYRCRTLNSVIGGARDSAHTYGCAADLVPVAPGVTLEQMIAWVVTSDLLFDQVIIEHSSTADWLHIGALRPDHEEQPRRQALRYERGTYTWWRPGVA